MRWTTTTIWFACVAVFVAANSFICYMNVRKVVVLSEEIARSRDLIFATDKVLESLVDAETGQRGYVVTGDVAFLEPYNKAISELDARIAAMKSLSTHSDSHRAHEAELGLLITLKLDEMAKIVRIRAENGFEPARLEITAGEGKHHMDGARKVIDSVLQHEFKVLKAKTGDRLTANQTATITLVTAGVINLLLLGVLSFVVKRQTRLQLRSRVTMAQNLVLENDNIALAVKHVSAEKHASILRELNTQLEASNKELESFASVASHDLQEPLRKIQAFGDRLNARFKAELGDEGGDYIARMQAAAARMQTLINDLLQFSRIATRAQPMVELDLNTIVTEVLGDLENRLETTHGKVEIESLPRLAADATQMRQLFQNLIANALKFHRPGVPPVVRISTVIEAGHAVISVSDNGIGFDEKYTDRIFNIFQRLHTRQEYEGTGIGLAVCRKIVERHGGTIEARSTPGAGSTFTVKLPLQPPLQ